MAKYPGGRPGPGAALLGGRLYCMRRWGWGMGGVLVTAVDVVCCCCRGGLEEVEEVMSERDEGAMGGQGGVW